MCDYEQTLGHDARVESIVFVQVAAADLRWAVGSILAEGDETPDDALRKTLEAEGYKVMTLPKVERLTMTLFPFKNRVSIFLAIYRVWKAWAEFMKVSRVWKAWAEFMKVSRVWKAWAEFMKVSRVWKAWAEFMKVSRVCRLEGLTSLSYELAFMSAA